LERIKAWAFLLSIAVLGSIVVACGGGADDTTSTADNDTRQAVAEVPQIEVPALWAWGDAQDLRTLTASADAVFRGKVVALRGQHTALPQTGGGAASGPTPRWASFPVSQFELQVESVMSGGLAAGTTILFEQMGGVESRPDGTQVKILLEKDELLAVGQTYLFFARIREDGVAEAAPFSRLKVSPDGNMSAGSGWGQLKALEQLSRMDLQTAEREIGAAAHE
jgi:hypothetical protein